MLLAALLVFALAVKAHLATRQAGGQSGGGAIIGVIQDDRGAPLANAKVTLTSGDLLTSKSTQVDGRF